MESEAGKKTGNPSAFYNFGFPKIRRRTLKIFHLCVGAWVRVSALGCAFLFPGNVRVCMAAGTMETVLVRQQDSGNNGNGVTMAAGQ